MLTIGTTSFKNIVTGLITKWRTTGKQSGVTDEQDSVTMTIKPSSTPKGLNRVSVLVTRPNWNSVGVLSGSMQGRCDFIMPGSSMSDARSEFITLVQSTLMNANIVEALVDLTPPSPNDVSVTP